MEMNKVSEKGRVRDLLQRLMSKDIKILIVLDDVWGIIDFENIGLPKKYCKYCSHHSNQCSIWLETHPTELHLDFYRDRIGLSNYRFS